MSRDHAIRKTLALLEKRWRHRLPDGVIPARMKKLLVRRDAFMAMVEIMEDRGALPLPDLDFHPVIETTLDGETRDLMSEELGFDPSDFVCIDCGHDTPQGQRRCEKCAHWRLTGERTP